MTITAGSQRELMAIIEVAARESTPRLRRSESPVSEHDPAARRSLREITGSKSVDEGVNALRARFPTERTMPLFPSISSAMQGMLDERELIEGTCACDAAYLWLAAELRTPLATFDRRLGEAARRHLRLPAEALSGK